MRCLLYHWAMQYWLRSVLNGLPKGYSLILHSVLYKIANALIDFLCTHPDYRMICAERLGDIYLRSGIDVVYCTPGMSI